MKNLPAGQETQIRALGQEDPLEKGMATHSIIPAWSIPQTEDNTGAENKGGGLSHCYNGILEYFLGNKSVLPLVFLPHSY